MTDQTKSFRFGRKSVGGDAPCLIIAEIGINHEGCETEAEKQVQAAMSAGADAVKFQIVNADQAYAEDTPSHTLFKSAELSEPALLRLFSLTKKLGGEPFATVGDLASIAMVERLNPPGYKISSGLLTSDPLITRLARFGRPLIFSTGMAEISQVDTAVAVARSVGASDIAILQCTSLYPAPTQTLNLNVIRWLAGHYGVVAGFSDHSEGTEAAPLAVAAGAQIIEKHFTLDRSRPGYDHSISLEPDEFGRMVAGIRRAEAMLGSAHKAPVQEEKDKVVTIHRHCAALTDLNAGTRLTEAEIGLIRLSPGTTGLPASAYESLIGRTLTRDVRRHQPIRHEDLA